MENKQEHQPNHRAEPTRRGTTQKPTSKKSQPELQKQDEPTTPTSQPGPRSQPEGAANQRTKPTTQEPTFVACFLLGRIITL